MFPKPILSIDFYKSGHIFQYLKGTELVYANFTARSAKLSNIPDNIFENRVVFFGLQYFLKRILVDMFQECFFDIPIDHIKRDYQRRMDNALGKGSVTTDHIEALHKLGYLPICIRALPEGTTVPIGVPMLVIYNTKPEFFWLTNYLETMLSCHLWKPIVSATTAYHYRRLLTRFATETGVDLNFVQFQGHDFSFRGMGGIEDAAISGAAHLTSFSGTDTIPAIDLLEEYYFANSDKELVGVSVPATEHSVMCMGTKEDEIGTIRRLITELYPAGFVSIVSDTWDFFKVITEYTKVLKDQILARDGRVVFRPDSGDPVKIICGDPAAPEGSPQRKGAVQCLWEVFGGTTTSKGYKVLDSHVGLIYGDSITPGRAFAIVSRLKDMGFASNNIVFGIGSYTYTLCTRDTYGMALKSTFGVVNGEPREIFKDPVTDVGSLKKSARGLIKVFRNTDGVLTYADQQQDLHPEGCLLEPTFLDGKILVDRTLRDIRARLLAA